MIKPGIHPRKIIDPKDITWKSMRYRKWIRDHCKCYTCGAELVNEREGYESHHHCHSGGETPSDHLLTALCLQCHNQLHQNESLFRSRHSISESEFDDHCMGLLMKYLDGPLNINPRWVAIIALKKAIEEHE